MAATAQMSAFEERAVRAEKLVEQLESRVAILRQHAEEAEMKRLVAANAELRARVEAAKKELQAAEAANGKLQVGLPDGSTPAAAAAPAASAAAASGAAAAPPKAKASKNESAAAEEGKAPKKKKEKKKGGGDGGKAKAAEQAANTAVDVSRINFVVGKIVEASMHPDADSLYVEKIDVGEGSVRTVLSGLAKYVPLEAMQGRMIVLCANLKPRKMRGIESQGMVMCASGETDVEPIVPPEGCVPGDVIEFEGYTRNPDAVLNPKKKIFEAVVPDLATNAKGEACYKGIPFAVAGKGVCVSKLKDTPVK